MAYSPISTTARTSLPVPAIAWSVLALICLPLAAVAGLSAARSPTLIIMGVGGIAVFGLAVLSPPAAIAGLLLTAGFVRIQLGTGTGSPIVASLLVALVVALAWIVRMIFLRDLHIVRSPVTFPLIAFVTVNILSFLWSRATLDPRIRVPQNYARVQIAALMVIALSATTVLVLGGYVRDHRWLAVYLGTLFLIGACHSLLLRLHISETLATGRGVISTWWVCLALAQALLNSRLRWWMRIALGLLSAYWLYELLSVIDWLSGWIPAVIAAFLVCLLSGRKIAIATVIVSALVVILLWGPLYKSVYTDQVGEGSIGGQTGRVSLWDRTLSTIEPSPWLGSGPAGYALSLVQFYPNDALSAHSNYIDVIAQSGVIGAAFFFWFLGAALFVGWRALQRLRARGDPFGVAIASGVLAGLVGVIVAMALGDWFIPFVYNQTIAGFDYTVESWLCIGMLIALDYMSRMPLKGGT